MSRPLSLQSAADDGARPLLSALVDGQADALEGGCRCWRDDPRARSDWHLYHLIGDAMRSDELASPPAHDAAFLAALRQRLAAEPVVLAPAPLAASKAPPARRRASAWLMPGAVAAGFVLVAGVLVVTRIGAPGAAPQGAVMAAAPAPAMTLVGTDARTMLPLRMVGDAVLRDARLDQYLAAHEAARGGFVIVAPGGALHRVDAAITAPWPVGLPAGARQ